MKKNEMSHLDLFNEGLDRVVAKGAIPLHLEVDGGKATTIRLDPLELLKLRNEGIYKDRARLFENPRLMGYAAYRYIVQMADVLVNNTLYPLKEEIERRKLAGEVTEGRIFNICQEYGYRCDDTFGFWDDASDLARFIGGYENIPGTVVPSIYSRTIESLLWYRPKLFTGVYSSVTSEDKSWNKKREEYDWGENTVVVAVWRHVPEPV